MLIIKYLLIIKLLIFLTVSSLFSQNQKFDSIANEVNILSIYKKTKTLELLDSMYQIAYNSPDNSMLIARCLYEEALFKERHKKNDTILYNNILQKLAINNLPLQEEALLYSALGFCLMASGDYSKAFETFLKALEQSKLLNDNLFIASTLNSLGTVCFKIGLYNLADNYYSESITWITSEKREFFIYKLNFFNNKAKPLEEYAIDSLINLLEYVEKERYEALLPWIYTNIGAKIFDENHEKAFIYLNKAQSIDFENEVLKAQILSGFASYYLKKGDYTKALKYIKDAQIVGEAQNSEYLSFIYEIIYLIFKELDVKDSALFYSVKYNEEKEKLRSNIVAIEKHQKRVTDLNEDYKQRLEEAKLTIKSKQIRNIIILICTSIFILLVLLILARIYRQTKNKETENSQLKSIIKSKKRSLEYEKKQRKLEKEKQQAIIDEKTREITSKSIILSNKKDTLQQVKNVTAQILNNNKDAVTAAAKIEEIVKNSLTIDNEWDNYKIHFDKVHPQFFKKLKNKCSRLTEENLKMCALIKMRLSKKQIARLLNISENTIKVSRQRLKKKIGLSEKESLDEFIDNI